MKGTCTSHAASAFYPLGVAAVTYVQRGEGLSHARAYATWRVRQTHALSRSPSRQFAAGFGQYSQVWKILEDKRGGLTASRPRYASYLRSDLVDHSPSGSAHSKPITSQLKHIQTLGQ